MKKNIYSWICKWHFIAGILSLPVVLLLSITGIIYLFKEDYENKKFEQITKVSANNEFISYQNQWDSVKSLWDKTPDALVLNFNEDCASQFTSGMFSHKSKFFIDPYSGKETGRIDLKRTDMYKVRKLHGELLLGGFGTKIIELVASWMVVLLLSGIYLFWPRERGIKSLFTIRTKQSKRLFFRDFHTVTGFWFSFFLLLILAGGLPWTDVFGSGYKWVQDSTDSGFPKTWNARGLQSEAKGEQLPLDFFVEKAQILNLYGEVTVHLPKSANGVFSISNQTTEFSKMEIFHFDQFSGELLMNHSWQDIGLMMKSRLWIMAFHQGEFGTWNFVLVFLTAFILFLMSLAALLSYFKRKPNGSWGMPKSSADLNIGVSLIVSVCFLGVLLPLFGASVIIISMISFFRKKIGKA